MNFENLNKKIGKLNQLIEDYLINGLVGFGLLFLLVFEQFNFNWYFFTLLIVAFWNLYYAFTLKNKNFRK